MRDAAVFGDCLVGQTLNFSELGNVNDMGRNRNSQSRNHLASLGQFRSINVRYRNARDLFLSQLHGQSPANTRRGTCY